MERIDWINGKVPINRTNLNGMQDNIEKTCVVVSATEPTTNESVWIKNRKNEFDKRNLEIVEHWNVNYTVDDNKKITVTVPQVTQAVAYIKTSNFVIPEGQHTISLKIEGQLNTIKLINAYNTDICIKDTNENTFTVDLAEDTTVFLYFYINPSSTANTLTIEDIQIEKGNTATVYEEYTDKEIYVKNENGVFERFYSENEMNKQKYSTEEQRIGTWIDGKPLYRKTIPRENLGAGSNNVSCANIYIDEITKIDFTAYTTSGDIISGNFNDGSINMYIKPYVGVKDVDLWFNTNVQCNLVYITLEYTKTTD